MIAGYPHAVRGGVGNSAEALGGGEELQSAIWLSCDLGVSGDYEGMYSWLENHGAKECGSSVAFLKCYEFDGDLPESLKTDVSDTVTLNRRSRIYVIFNDNGRVRGRYVVGNRKAPPWTGFGDEPDQEVDEE